MGEVVYPKHLLEMSFFDLAQTKLSLKHLFLLYTMAIDPIINFTTAITK